MAARDMAPDEVFAMVRSAVAAAPVRRPEPVGQPHRRLGSAGRAFNLPDAVAVAVGAYACHRAGLTGRGVRIGLSDSGVGAADYFSARSYRVEPDCAGRDGHGTGMAAILLAIAPDATVICRPAGGAALGAMLRANAVDVILCAWGARDADSSLRFDSDPPVIAADPGPPGQWPANAYGVTAVGGGTAWPTGPYSLPAGHHSWSGASVAAAACCAVVALAIAGGVDPRVAIELATPTSPQTGT